VTTKLPESNRYPNRLPPTPLVPIQLAPDDPMIWCKLEFLNPSGSTKDHLARFIMEKAWRQGTIGPESVVVEASSGSTSIAFALTCAQLGLKFIAVMPEGVSNERALMIRAYGGEVRFTPEAEDVRGSIDETERMAEQDRRIFLPRQFSNPDNPESHRVGPAREILDQIPCGSVDVLVSGVGTGGTLMGLFQGLTENGCEVIPVHARPVNITRSPETECCSYSHCIPGLADRISTIYREDLLPGLITLEIEDNEAIATTRRLIRRGFPVGPSSGLNYHAAVMIARQLANPQACIVTVFPDRMERYFTTELFDPFKTT